MTTTVIVKNDGPNKKVGVFYNNPQTDLPSITLDVGKSATVTIYPGKEAFLKEL